MPYELVITDAKTLKEDVIGFGNNKLAAQTIFNWTWRGLLRDGYVSISNVSNPWFVEIAPKRGASVLFIELRDRQPVVKAALSNHTVEIEAFYRARYQCGGWIETEPDFIREIESATRATWYELGLYDKRGYDYDGRSYTLTADDRLFEDEQVCRDWQREQDDLKRERMDRP